MTSNPTPLPSKSQALVKAQGSLLGAAVGDALGWPQEIPKNSIIRRLDESAPRFSFQEWERRAGGRYKPHNEVILPGEYSDDTQLILSTARSLLYKDHWWEHLTKAEFPLWLCYQRGGGGATLRAIRSWAEDKEPWANKKISQRYFEAGGNGVAMRILPHTIYGIFDSDFSAVARGIFANGIATHGHPRALLGALSYGFALWIAFREMEPLSYGKLIEILLTEISTWSALPQVEERIFTEWKESAGKSYNNHYQKQWKIVVDEMASLLSEALDGINQGAISIDLDLLEKLGCFGKEKGSGVITSAGAIFLASRYAAEPINGLLEAAYARGADTDTLASMTGALLGSIAGYEWLRNSVDRVQDAKYIKDIGRRIVERDYFCRQDEQLSNGIFNSVELFDRLEQAQVGSVIVLPNLQTSKIVDSYLHSSSAKATRARSWKLDTSDGQTIYLKKTWYEKESEPSSPKKVKSPELPSSKMIANRINTEAVLLPVRTLDSSSRLLVRDLEEAKLFYGKVLGLKCHKESKSLFRYGNIWLAEMPKADSLKLDKSTVPHVDFHDIKPSVWIEVESIVPVYENVVRVGLPILKDISVREEAQARFFICRDPSNHIILISEVPDF